MKNWSRFLRGSLALSSLFLALTCFSQAHAQTPAAAPEPKLPTKRAQIRRHEHHRDDRRALLLGRICERNHGFINRSNAPLAQAPS